MSIAGQTQTQTYALTYDTNGNLTQKQNTAQASDKTIYTWDASNRLSQISQTGATQTNSLNASFTYDAMGRRIQSSIAQGTNAAQTVQYLYEGQQALGEIRNGQLSHRLITGLSLDETIARIAITSSGQKDAANSRIFMTDALSSVIAQLSDDAANPGQMQNSYGYSPYGEAATVGPDATPNPNPIQYTSRENDKTGLMYYRARYYDPVLKRFISSDPIGLAGGINMYGYVGGNPITSVDPRGLDNPSMGPYGPYPGSMGFRRGTPGNSCTCMVGSNTFYAPPGANFSQVHSAGQANGWNPIDVNRNVGHWGAFDFQRDLSMNQFTRAYTDSANFAVGVYMHGAGYSRANTTRIAGGFASAFSSNAGDPNQIKYWKMGWDAANSGNLEYVCQ